MLIIFLKTENGEHSFSITRRFSSAMHPHRDQKGKRSYIHTEFCDVIPSL